MTRLDERDLESIWDTKIDQPAEADRRRYVDLQLDEATECAVSLNRADAASGERFCGSRFRVRTFPGSLRYFQAALAKLIDRLRAGRIFIFGVRRDLSRPQGRRSNQSPWRFRRAV
jgi:hypothetical protein